MKILVCGGRNYKDKEKVYIALAKIAPTIVITGGCPSGADFYAKEFCRDHKVDIVEYPAQWNLLGPKAGPMRNQYMLDTNTDIKLVAAFPGGRGTQDMVKRALKAKIVVIKEAE